MSLITIYLRDSGGNYDEGRVRTTLENYFKAVCRTSGATITDAVVLWWGSENFPPQPPFQALKSHDIVVYVLKSYKDSIVGRLYNNYPGNNDAGQTAIIGGSGPMISEVYLDRIFQSAEALTNMIFHELMHNKLQKGNSQLHGNCAPGITYLAGNNHLHSGKHRMFGQIAKPETKMSECDLRLMAPYLHNRVLQYTGAIK